LCVVGYFKIGNYLSGADSSWVARITGVSHWCLARRQLLVIKYIYNFILYMFTYMNIFL
jgi:hypothetical protein